MAEEWHLYRDGQRYGPYAWQDLLSFAQTGNLAPSDLLWSQGLTDWTPADRIPGLLAPAATAPSTPVYATAPATYAPTATAASAPTRKRGALTLVLVLVAVLALGGGAVWWFWLRDGDTRGQQASLPGSITPTPSATPPGSEAFWQSAELEAAIAAMDDGDWRNYPDLAAEQAAIGKTLSGFGAAMQAGDLGTAVSHILPERQEAYRELFASNPNGMASFGALLDEAVMSFLSEHADTSAHSRTAEYAVEVDGFTFYLLLMKTADGWVLYDF